MVVSGCFIAPRGFKGETFVEIYQKDRFLPKDGEFAYLKEAKDFNPFLIERFFSYEKGSVLKFAEIKTKEEVNRLIGKEFFLQREEETDFLGKEFLGFEVFDLKRGKIGEISDFAILPSYILLYCNGKSGGFEIPLIKDLGLKLIREERKIFFDLPEEYPGVDYEN